MPNKYLHPTALELFKSLSDDTRLMATLLIAERDELCVCELMAALDISQPKISRHLALLRKSGLLLDRREGQWVYYALHPQLMTWALAIIESAQKVYRPNIQLCLSRMQRACV